MKEQYKSSIIKSLKITNNFFDGVSLKGYVAS